MKCRDHFSVMSTVADPRSSVVAAGCLSSIAIGGAELQPPRN